MSMLRRLVERGDRVSLSHGRLDIVPASGVPVPEAWLAENSESLVLEILQATGVDGLAYFGYSTGTFGGRFPGVSLQFASLLTGESRYAIFNAELKRARPSKDGRHSAGDPLPKGCFRVGKRSLFNKFWSGTGLKIPPRLSSFHDYMGLLGRTVFVGESGASGRLRAETIAPLNISSEAVRKAILPDKSRTSPGQVPDKCHTKLPDKETQQIQSQKGFQPDSTTRHTNYELSKQGSAVTRNPSKTLPINQTADEWLAELGDDYGCFSSMLQ